MTYADPRSRLLPVLVVAVHLVFGIAYQWTVPIFEGPDEPSHLHYVGFIASEGRLPRYGTEPDVPGEGMQPPLYYLLMAPLFAWRVAEPSQLLPELERTSRTVYRIERDAILANRLVRPKSAEPGWNHKRYFQQEPRLEPLLLLRWPGRLLGALAVLVTFFAARRAFRDESLAVLAAALLGLSPQFLFVSGYVGNDAAGTAVGAAALWLVVVGLENPRRSRDYLFLALLSVVGLLTKTSTLPGLAVAGLALFLSDSREMRTRLRDASACAGFALVLAAPYLVWASQHRGDLLGMGAVLQSAEGLPAFDFFGGFWSFFVKTYWDLTFESYWARFGWMLVTAPKAIYLAFFALTFTGLLGFALTGRRGDPGGRESAGVRRYLLAVFLASLAAHLWLNLQIPQPQGRHLFPAAPQIACLLAIGLRRVTGAGPERIGVGAAATIVLSLAGLALYCLLFVIAPVYVEG